MPMTWNQDAVSKHAPQDTAISGRALRKDINTNELH